MRWRALIEALAGVALLLGLAALLFWLKTG